MHNESTNDFSNLENQFNNWLGSKDQTRKVACHVADTQLIVIFNQGHWTYPSYSRTPKLKKDTVNVATSDPLVKVLFENSLKKLSSDYQFPDRRLGLFKLRFFKDASSVEKKIDAENEDYKRNQEPHSGCIIL